MQKVEFFIGWGTGRRTFGTVEMDFVPRVKEWVMIKSHRGNVRYEVRAVEHIPDFETGDHLVEITLDLP